MTQNETPYIARKFRFAASMATHPDFRAAAKAHKINFLPENVPILTIPFPGKPGMVFIKQVDGLCYRLSALRCKSVVLGLSGGLDSSLALLVAHAAFSKLKLNKKGICVLSLPGFGTTKHTTDNAKRLVEALGLEMETISIANACRQHLKDIGHDGVTQDVTYENAQARMRTLVLMDRANQIDGIVLGTGDMSEIALGWCTFNGDHMSMFGVNAGVPKTIVREVCEWYAERYGGKVADALRAILDTPISPELLPAKDGEIQQKTEDKIGPYELHDFFLCEYCGFNKSTRSVMAAAKREFANKYDAATIAKWFGVFKRRLFTQAFKRNCMPDGIKIFTLYLGPYNWHIPSDFAAAVPWNYPPIGASKAKGRKGARKAAAE